ncbi:SUN domain-containing protein 2-like [Protopterus annectens]|uniref:SUN domain-containing protein 2-like n=1 Tax=Protopterus annectens TaxID=7888 RepID=UPI001CFA6EC3|nr:SUN domain-containing protein 2-like [Protopterus annectens]
MTQKHEKIPLKRQMLMKEELAEIKEMIKEMQKIKEETEYLFEVLPSWSQNDPEYQVKAIVNRALKLYSEDRIGLADYALESAGASVLTAYCSETYEKQQIIVTLFGIPLWYRQQSPNVILQPDVYPGNCWAFAGDKGFVTIKLASRIKPTAFTLDHIPKSVSPIGSINTAPRDFSIFGISDPADMTMNLLGKYTYDKNGSPIQTFLVQANPVRSYNIIRMNVDSNWGHPEYTCIYRLRVHGELVN